MEIIPLKPPQASSVKENTARKASVAPTSPFIAKKSAAHFGTSAIFLTTSAACPRLSALKKIHAKVTKQKVTRIFTAAGILAFSKRGLAALPAHW